MASYPRGLTRRPRHARIAARPRLTSIPARGKLTIIEAPSGAGKSVLAAQLTDALNLERQGWCRLAPGWSQATDIVPLAFDSLGLAPDAPTEDLIVAAGQLLELLEDQPTSLVIDDLHESEGSDAERLLAEVAAFLPEQAAVIVTTRRRPAELIGLVDPALLNLVGATDLHFDESETRQLLARRGADESAAASLLEAVGPSGAALATASDAGSIAEGIEKSLGRLFADDALGPLAPVAHSAAVLPYLSPALVAELGVGDTESLHKLAQQTSLFTETAGTWQLHATARAHLTSQVDDEQANQWRRQAAAALSATDPMTSIGLLVEAGANEQAGDLLAANAAQVGPARATRWLYALPAEIRQRMPPVLTGGRATVNVSVAILSAHQQVAAASNDRDRAQHLLGLGSLLLADGDLTEAAEALESALRLADHATNADVIREQLALTRWYAGDTRGAIAALGPDLATPWANWLRAQMALVDGHFDEAQNLGALAAQDADGNDITAAPGLATTAAASLGLGDHDSALKTAATAYEQALAVGGRDLAAAGWVYVWCLLFAQDLEAAEAVCDQLQRSVGRHDYATRVNIALARKALAELGNDPDLGRAQRRVGDLRAKGFAVLETLATTLAPQGNGPPKDLVHVRLLGAFDMNVEGSLLTSSGWKSKKAHEVCAYLAQAGPTGCRREEVIEAVWPQRPPDKGRTLLRTALTEVRKVLEPRRAAGAPSRFVVVEADRVILREATTDLRQAQAALTAERAGEAFALVAPGLAHDAPASDWLVELEAVIGRICIEAATRVVADPASPPESIVAAYEALIAAEPWGKAHFDGLIDHYKAVGDQASAADVERRWFSDDEG